MFEKIEIIWLSIYFFYVKIRKRLVFKKKRGGGLVLIVSGFKLNENEKIKDRFF